MCDLKVGEDAVCVKTHSKRVVVKGNVYPVLGLQKSPCNCSKLDVNVGIKDTTSTYRFFSHCNICGVKFIPPIINDGIWWINADLLRPLDSISDITELTEILEQPIFETKK